MAEEIKDLFAVQEDTEQTAIEQNTEVAEETTTEQTEEESAEGEESTEEEESESSAEQTKETKSSNPYEKIILAEMQKRAEQGDTLLATALQSKDKSIAECWRYIVAQARKKASGNCAMLEDEIVFGWAHHYYIESKETIDAELKTKSAPKEKTAEQKKAEEQTKKVYANPLLAALIKKGGKVATDGTIAVTKTTERKDKDGNLLFSKAVKTDAQGTKTTTIEKGGKTFTMTEFSLF